MNKLILTLLIALAVAAVTQGKKCKHNGISYKPKTFYMDDCNKCRCLKNGIGVCSKKACPPRVCKVNGKMYGAGEIYRNGCNKCICNKDGTSDCKPKFCEPKAFD
ncbi:hypothetical protein ACF0H5_021350 [Mactra antiquata]